MKVALLITLSAICLCIASPCSAQTGSFADIGKKAEIFDQVCSAAVLTSTAERMSVFDQIACGSYIQGLADGMLARDQGQALASKGASVWPCFPRGVTSRELIGVVLNFLASHPEMKENPTGGVAAIAFMHRFQCGSE